jgi:TM2 domain-containing membrane protein YozV
MSDSYYVRMQGHSLGPYSLDRLRQMTRKGQVGKANEVSIDGASWAPASSFPEIFEWPSQAAGSIVGGSYGQSAVAVATEPLPSAPVVQSEPQWYYAIRGQQQGPTSKAELISLIRSGGLSPSDHVFCEGAANWVLASEAAELASAFAPQGLGPSGGGLAPGIDAFCRECGAGVNRRAIMCPKCGAPVGAEILPPVATGSTVPFVVDTGATRRRSGDAKSKTTAALLALLIGGLGAHHFYLGNAVLGIVYILLCWTLIPALISFIEAIVFLTMSDDAFDAKYNS